MALLIISSLVIGCKSGLEVANEQFNLHEYAVAALRYEKLLKDPKLSKLQKQTIAFQAGEAYRLNHDTKNALKMYAKSMVYGRKDSIVQFRKAEMLMRQQRYEEALDAFHRYKKDFPDDKDVDRLIAGCEMALKNQ